ncbi:MAG: anthranilate synthase component I [Gemmatimonadota bacterium]
MLLPLTRTLLLDGDTPVSAFAKLHRGSFGFLLESLEGAERWARYTFLGTEPKLAYRYRGRSRDRWTPEAGWEMESGDESPLTHLAEVMRRYPAVEVPGLPRFVGGAVGYIGYDVVRTLEDLPNAPPDDRDLPDAIMMITETLLVFDNLYNRATIIHNVELPPHGGGAERRALIARGEQRMEEWVNRLSAPGTMTPLPVAGENPLEPVCLYSREQYMADVARIQEYIGAGDTFQTVLSRRIEVAAPDPWRTYRHLRALNPAPYLFFLQLDDIHLLGSSPEVLVRVEADELTVRPIAGTRPRGSTPAEDARLEAELRADPKEQAEHLMLVDLGRNDVGRVATFGSVRVTELMSVEKYSHVMHLVSEVRGTLKPEHDAISALSACFPAGTVSGAPKVRAMEIIDELEPTRRGPYAGAVGYIGWGGRTLDTAIAIRCCVMRGGRAWVQAGAGIVADSDPQSEYRETESKGRAVLKALAMASQ